MSKILVLGGDGFCGWPTSLHLAEAGHRVTIVDNFSRQKIDKELGVDSLTPRLPLAKRLSAWKEVAGKSKEIAFVKIDVAKEPAKLTKLIGDLKPDTIIHFAEQRSAPYSQKSPSTMRYTVDNNVRGTNNLMVALYATGVDAHVIHLGTMGVYGYGQTGKAPIPEGRLKVRFDTPDGEQEKEIVYPPKPGSVYHTTKVLDHQLLSFYNGLYGIRTTDLHQGIVWGTDTDQTKRDVRLINQFDYDGDYGTVLNRFLSQAAIGYPLTVNGKGNQTRAFIHIQNTAQCVELAVNNPPTDRTRPAIFNQVTETHRINDLAKKISKLSGVGIEHVPNPRVEAEENDLVVENNQFLSLGLEPITLDSGLMEEITNIAKKYADRIDKSKIPATSKWRQDK